MTSISTSWTGLHSTSWQLVSAQLSTCGMPALVRSVESSSFSPHYGGDPFISTQNWQGLGLSLSRSPPLHPPCPLCRCPDCVTSKKSRTASPLCAGLKEDRHSVSGPRPVTCRSGTPTLRRNSTTCEAIMAVLVSLSYNRHIHVYIYVLFTLTNIQLLLTTL